MSTALDLNEKLFIVYIASLSLGLTILIYQAGEAKLALLLTKKLAPTLPKCIKVNRHIIDLQKVSFDNLPDFLLSLLFFLSQNQMVLAI